MKIERFEDIEAWQLARDLTRKVYRLTRRIGFKEYETRKVKPTVNREPLNPTT